MKNPEVDLTRYEGIDEGHIIQAKIPIESVLPPEVERFALLDFREVRYTDYTRRFQVVFVDRKRGWAKVNGVHLKESPTHDPHEARKLAWLLLRTWAEEVALDRLHPVDQTHRGGLQGCVICDHLFRWIKNGGFGEVPQ